MGRVTRDTLTVMNSRHLIDTAVFDISYGQQEVAHEQQPEIDSFVKNDLMVVVDEVFNEVSNQGLFFRIDNLEIDLGDILYHDYQEEMPKRLREQLKSILAEIRHKNKIGQASENEVIDKESAELEQLFYYFRTGYLPWYSRLSDAAELNLLLERAVNIYPEKFIGFVDNTPQSNAVFERIAKQLSENSIKQVITLLSSSHSNLAQKYIRDLNKHLRSENIPLSLDENSADESQAESVSLSESKRGDSDILSAQLVSALLSGDTSSIHASWSDYYDDHANLLERVLRHYGQQVKVRKHIAAGFSDEMLNDVLVLLEPTEHGFIKEILGQPEVFQLETNDQTPNAVQYKAALWEFSVSYLLVERGSQFNKKSYLRSLLGQMAASKNLNQSTLITVLREKISALKKANKLAGQVLHLLSEISRDMRLDADKREANDINEFDLYESYERLKISASRDKAGNYINRLLLKGDIESLAKKSPWLLLRLFQELKLGAYSRHQASVNFTAPLLIQLVHAYLSLTIQSDSSQQSDFINAIQINAERSSNQKSFYLYILECLINGKEIDFESIEAEGLKEEQGFPEPDNSTGSNDLTGQPTNDSVEELSNEQAYKIVTDMLGGDGSLSVKELVKLDRSLDVMKEQQPLVLRRFIELGIDNHEFVERLASQLHESLNVKLLSIISMANYADMLRCAELLNMACYGKKIGIELNNLKLQKWQFIYFYINKTGGLFNEQYFVQQYVAALEKKNPLDSKQFRSVFSKQLLKNTLPSTQQITHKIIKSLSSDEDETPEFSKRVEIGETESGLEQHDEQKVVEEIYISNAGIVLAAPYLPRLFEMLGLTEASAFKDRLAAERGVHMLQFVVNENCSSPEFQLVLNKLLCGVKPGLPIRHGIELSTQETDQLEGLLHGMMQHWKSLHNTSIAGLRESFLQRQGKLQLKGDAWHLSVESKPFDMLMDQIPWSYNTIKFPWMDRVIYVEWR